MIDVSSNADSVQEQAESFVHLPLMQSVLPLQPSGSSASVAPGAGMLSFPFPFALLSSNVWTAACNQTPLRFGWLAAL